MAMTIALFGGAFDPPHLGHVLAACTARLHGVDAVWILPSARHPYGKNLSPWPQRLELCHAAFGPLGDWCVVREDEQDNPSGTTWDLLDLLDRRHPSTKWCLVGGTDTAQDLPRWHRGPELAQRLPVLAIPRRGWDHQHPAALPDIRSRSLRADLQAGQPWEDRVPPAVATLIRSRNWYTST